MSNKLYFLLAIAGIFILYFLSCLQQPQKINLQELHKYNGRKVIVCGIIKNKIGNLLEISDGKARAKIYYDGNKELEYGDEIKIVGKVGEYGNDFVIYAEEVDTIKKWDNDSISVAYLAENYQEFVNTNVNVTGYIYSAYTNYFYLTDEYIEYKIKVYTNESKQFEKGERVYVKALFFYNPKSFNFCLKLCQDFHKVGKYD